MNIKNSIWLKMTNAQKILTIVFYLSAWVGMNIYCLSNLSTNTYVFYFNMGTIFTFNVFMVWASVVLVQTIRLLNEIKSEE